MLPQFYTILACIVFAVKVWLVLTKVAAQRVFDANRILGSVVLNAAATRQRVRLRIGKDTI